MAAIFIPVIFMFIVMGLSTAFVPQFQIQWTVGPAMLVPTLLLTTLQAGLGEEIGWRGYATPKLMEKRSALVSSLIVGTAWSAWHVPLYFIPGTLQNNLVQQMGFPLTLITYSIFLIALAEVYSWIYLASNKNLWLPILMHGSTNYFSNLLVINNFDDFGLIPIIILFCLWVAMAFAVTLIFGPQRMSKMAIGEYQTSKGIF